MYKRNSFLAGALPLSFDNGRNFFTSKGKTHIIFMMKGSTMTFKILSTEFAVRLNLWTRVTIQLIKSSLATLLHGVICLPILSPYSIVLIWQY